MQFLQITATGWVAIIIALSMAILAGIMFLLGTERVHYVWGVFCLAVATWAGGFYMVTISNGPEMAQFWWRIAYIGLILNPFTFFHFSLEFINNSRLNKYKLTILAVLYSIAIIFLYLDLGSNLIIKNVTFLFDEIYYDTPPALLHPYFTVAFLLLVLLAFVLVFREYTKRKTDFIFRQQALYFFIATLIGFVGGSMNFLAVYNIEIHPITNLGVAFGAGLIAYAIFKYRLFDVRVVIAQPLTLILVAFTAIRLVLSTSTQEIIFNLLLLLVTLVVGIYLVLSVRKEIEQREKIADLANKLKDLSELKSEFISLATHHISSPLTAIKGYVSLLQESDSPEDFQKNKETLSTVQRLTNSTVNLVQDFIDVNKIDEQKLTFEFTDFYIRELIDQIVVEYKPIIERRSIDFEYKNETTKNIVVHGDKQKIRQAVCNILENSIKYSENGYIHIKAEMMDLKYLITLTDNGVRNLPTISPRLLRKLTHSGNVGEANIIGNGLGIYAAKLLIEGNKGRLWIESHNSETKFNIELPTT
jgi:signal transduction histidine kinase